MNVLRPKSSLAAFQKILLVADSHLGCRKNDIEEFSHFLRREVPICSPSHLIILGDFFHVWTIEKKFHTPQVKKILRDLFRLTLQGIQCFFLIGNRDLLFRKILYSQEVTDSAPFCNVSPDFLMLQSVRGRTLLFHHGDLINSKDRQYLLWRNFSRSFLFQNLLRLFPRSALQNLMQNLERKIKKTNSKFRILFPEEEWIEFTEKIHRKTKYDALICGHYHPENLICRSVGNSKAIIMKAWMDDQSYAIIDAKANFSSLHYRSESPL